MDGHQVAHFMRELFGDIILREREERQALMASAAALLDAPAEGQTRRSRRARLAGCRPRPTGP